MALYLRSCRLGLMSDIENVSNNICGLLMTEELQFANLSLLGRILGAHGSSLIMFDPLDQDHNNWRSERNHTERKNQGKKVIPIRLKLR